MSTVLTLARVLKVTATITSNFLCEQIGLLVTKGDAAQNTGRDLPLRSCTAVIKVSGAIELSIAFSFDRPLIERIFQVYSQELDVDLQEHSELIEQTSADLINIIVGNATGHLAEQGSLMTLSVPMVFNQACPLDTHKDQYMVTTLTTDCGEMTIAAIPDSMVSDTRGKEIEIA